MPLPDRSLTWPPEPIQPALDRMRIWDAWWSGDTDELTTVYGGQTAAQVFHPNQWAGGMVGRFARWWWGRPPAQGEPGAKVHVPLASDICRASADLLFSEPITARCDDEKASEWLAGFLDDGAQAKLLEGAEIAAALGGAFLRPAYHQDVADRAWIDAVSPDCAWPEWTAGRLSACTLWRVVGQDSTHTWRHLERHEAGRVQHGLYVGSRDELGRPVPLVESESTAHLAEWVDSNSALPTGHDELAVVYIPNMRPNRRWRRDAMLSPYGRSDLDGIEPLCDALDEVMSSWMRDVRLAKGRIIVPETYLEHLGAGKGARFDPDREAYSALPGMMETSGGDSNMITVQQFAIRVAEHDQTARQIIAQALRTAGYSAQTFGDSDAAAATATEVVARERRSFVTRNRKIQYWRPQLQHLFRALVAVDAHAYGRAPVDTTGLTVAFEDSVSEDPGSLAQTASLLAGAGAASRRTLVEMVHPDWDETQVDAEVALLEAEDRAERPDTDLGALGRDLGDFTPTPEPQG